MSGSEGAVKISVRVHPNAAKNQVVGFTDGVLQIRLAAPPVRGKANKELIDLLSQLLSMSKSKITITRGHTARDKAIAIYGLSREEAVKRLSTG